MQEFAFYYLGTRVLGASGASPARRRRSVRGVVDVEGARTGPEPVWEGEVVGEGGESQAAARRGRDVVPAIAYPARPRERRALARSPTEPSNELVASAEPSGAMSIVCTLCAAGRRGGRAR